MRVTNVLLGGSEIIILVYSSEGAALQKHWLQVGGWFCDSLAGDYRWWFTIFRFFLQPEATNGKRHQGFVR